ncbi:phosphoribosyltransferase [Peterkaempfera bronchialis]|uniref:Phosphoribosyltransferase n=1 Tax=Peterkaempfera bronchialis TaxID=2126346 RepID=A0A345T5Q2_9ACTN|nr:phosphoribosyltransferase family protein [Peterkaempfera bronchialis]AXI81307.1 phosphoribosyltransferase [Peterkaempfera bronchialis]
MRFQDRREAGRALAEELRERQRAGALPEPLVFGLPRGGLPVAREVADALGAPLEALVARKIGAPGQPELAIGAIAGEAPPLWDQEALRWLHATPEELAPLAERERVELRRREALYRQGRPVPELAGRTAVVVDDGLATGFTARAALRSVRIRHPARLVLAVPVGSREATEALAAEADEVVCLHQPYVFGSVGRWYEDFGQLTDDQVLELLRGG